MLRVARMRLLTPSWIGAILLSLIGSTSCDNTAPDTGGSPGSLTLVTTTTGIQTDGDGYTIMVDGTAHGSIGPIDSVTVEGVAPGAHAVELADIEFNCATI